MDKHMHIAVNTSNTDMNPYELGSLYANKYTSWLVILVGLDHLRDNWGQWRIKFIRIHDNRTFYATYATSEWNEHWIRIA